MVGKTGFEPATSWSQTKRSTKLSYFPKNDINYISFCLKSQEDFYFFKMACPRGLEPPAFWSVVRRSIQLSYRHIMAVPTGLEPAISSVTDWHVNHYTMEPLVAGEGFEPTTSGLWAQRATSCSIPRYKWRRKQDSNPRALSRLSVFKTDPFSRTWVFLRIIYLYHYLIK